MTLGARASPAWTPGPGPARDQGLGSLLRDQGSDESAEAAVAGLSDAAWQRTCFYSSPIGEPGTELRQHSDAFLDSLVEPAVAALDPGMEVIRADRLPSSPITAKVFEHVICSRLLIADLSYHNANVLHEVGLRHASGKPCVLISRIEDEIPANLRDVRIVLVNTSQIWTFVSEIESHRSMITDYARWALSSDGQDSSPVQRLFPTYRKYFR